MMDGTRLQSRLLSDADAAACFSGRAPASGDAGCRGGAGRGRGRRRRRAGKLRGADSGGGSARSCTTPDRLAAEATEAGNPVIPVVRHLTARVAESDAHAARFVHWGANSQDILDTGLVLQLRAAVPGAIDHLARGVGAAAAHAQRHRDATMAGRTWLQQATPITFGLKAAGLGRRARPGAATPAKPPSTTRSCCSSEARRAPWRPSGRRVLAVTDRLAAWLELPVPDIPWHAHRDRFHAARLRARDRGRHGWQDRARHRPAGPDRSRRSGRGGGAGTRADRRRCRRNRIRWRRRSPSPPPAARPVWSRRCSRRWSRTRTRPRRLAGRVGYPARPRDLRGQRGPGGRRRAGRPAGRHGPHARQRRGVRRPPTGPSRSP